LSYYNETTPIGGVSDWDRRRPIRDGTALTYKGMAIRSTNPGLTSGIWDKKHQGKRRCRQVQNSAAYRYRIVAIYPAPADYGVTVPLSFLTQRTLFSGDRGGPIKGTAPHEKITGCSAAAEREDRGRRERRDHLWQRIRNVEKAKVLAACRSRSGSTSVTNARFTPS